MKRLIACLLSGSLLLTATAQRIEDVKISLMQNNLVKAKADLDKVLANSKLNGKPEAQFQKASLYAAMALDTAIQQKPAADPFARLAEEGYDKYKTMDASMEFFSDPIYVNSGRNLYYTFYLWSIRFYNNKQYDSALLRVEKSLDLAAALAKKGQMEPQMATDPYFLSLAGECADLTGQKSKALDYYRRIADSAVKDPAFETVYRNLVRTYFLDHDYANFEKYKSIGAGLFPRSEFFKADKTDFAFGLAESFDAKMKLAKDVLAETPNDYKINMAVGQLLFDTLNSEAEGAVKPANAAELEDMMMNCFRRAAAAKPEEVLPNFFIGDFYYEIKAKATKEARNAHNREMQARTKPGTKASAEDLAKRDQLDLQLIGDYNNAITGYEKIVEILKNRATAEGELELQEREIYKKCVDKLSSMFAFKKANAKQQKDAFTAKKDPVKAKAADADEKKFEAEEKKYNELYDTINTIKIKKREKHSE